MIGGSGLVIRHYPMNAVSIAHVSDLHLPFEPRLSPSQRLSKRQLSAWSWRRRRALHKGEILEALVKDLRAHAVDHIVVTGDVTNFSLPDEFRRAAAWLEQLAPAGAISLVPGNHDALVEVADAQGLGRWTAWTRAAGGWPSVHHLDGLVIVGLNSALPTAPLLARGRLGPEQLARLEDILRAEGRAGRVRIVLVHHPVADGVVSWRKALADRAALRGVLARVGAELVLHGHARDSSLGSLPGAHGPIPCLCVPSSSAVPNPRDEGARWNRLTLSKDKAQVLVRRWSMADEAFVDDRRFTLDLPTSLE